MPNFLNFNNMSNYGIGYTDNLYNQSLNAPALPNLFNNAQFGCFNMNSNPFQSSFVKSFNENAYFLQSSPFECSYENAYPPQSHNLNESPVAAMTSNIKDRLMYMLLMKTAANIEKEQAQSIEQYRVAEPDSYSEEDEYSPSQDEDFSYDSDELKSTWRRYDLSDEFYSKVVSISKKIKCNPDELMAVMKSESGLDSKAVNPNGGATGLIQFMPKTARGLGTSTRELKRMKPEDQLDYVEKYLLQMKKMSGIKSNSQIDGATLYSLVFLPAHAKEHVLCERGSAAYNANKGLDLNHDGDIDKNDLNRRVKNLMA